MPRFWFWANVAQGVRLVLVAAAGILLWPHKNAPQAETPPAIYVREHPGTQDLKITSLIATPHPLGHGEQALLVHGTVAYDGPRRRVLPPLRIALMSKTDGVSQKVAFGWRLTASELCRAQSRDELLGQLNIRAQHPRPWVEKNSHTPFSALFAPFERHTEARWLVVEWDEESP